MPDAVAGLTPAVRRYLEVPPRHATLATSGTDGMPHVSVIWYRLDEDDILVNSRVGGDGRVSCKPIRAAP